MKKEKKIRKTKLVRFSTNSHKEIKKFAKARKMTMSKTLDHIVNRYFKHQGLYELD